MLRTLRPPYREVDTARAPSVGLLPNLRNVNDLDNIDRMALSRLEHEPDSGELRQRNDVQAGDFPFTWQRAQNTRSLFT